MKTILVADDDELILTLLREKLKKQGYSVVTVTTGTKAFEVIKQILPDMVILDGNMPEKDGFEVLKLVRKTDYIKNIPIIMLTARREKQDVLQGIASGITDYIVKPFTVEEVIKRIEAAFNKIQAVKDSQAPITNKPMIQFKGLAQAQDDEIDKKMGVIFLETHEANRTNLINHLSKTYSIIFANNDVDTLKLLENPLYKIVFIDCDISNLDWASLITKIRAYGKSIDKYHTIIGMGEQKKSENKRWLLSGMNNYYEKPLAMTQFSKIIKIYEQDILEKYL